MAHVDRIRLGITAALALAAACSAQGTGGQGGQGGAASSAQGSGHGSTAASSSSQIAVAAVTSGAGGSTAFVCNPPAAPGSIFEATAESYGALDPVPMCKYRGDVLLIVNVAAL
jgi:hypothetical protein